jgi:hypothetical protein
VIDSHGNHIPAKVRDAATFLFWVPRLHQSPGEEELPIQESYIQNESLKVLLDYVAEQITCFCFPGLQGLVQQYKDLQGSWNRLLADPTIAKEHICIQ